MQKLYIIDNYSNITSPPLFCNRLEVMEAYLDKTIKRFAEIFFFRKEKISICNDARS